MTLSYEEKVAKIENIVSSPMRRFKPDELKGIVERYERNHPKSKEAFERARKTIPGGVEHNLAFNYPFPLASKRVYDVWMETVDNVKLLDFLMCGGPIILGHNYKPLTDKVVEVIKELGSCHGITNEYEYRAAEQLQKYFPSCERVRWLQSGTEADMLAIRVARVFTGNKHVIKIGGHYHGWSDQLVYDLHIPGTKRMESHGIPKNIYKYIDSVPPNDIEALRKKFKEKRRVAAVILEPMGAESGAIPVRPGFNKEVAELCHENGTLMISDEVVTAFRLDMGGAQRYFGYEPDISVFGKIVGHGYPSAAAIGGRADVLSTVAAGVGGGSKRAYCGGTLAANPLTCAAAYWAMKFVEETNASEKAGKVATKLSEGLNEIFEKYNLPWFSYNYNATVHFHSSCVFGIDITDPTQAPQIKERKEFMEHMGAALVDQEIISVAGSRFYTCMQHNDDHINSLLQKIDSICQKIE
ncbi:MAG: aminotransferase class III-fold pyridoxal phosphate-dependent enzyme [Candidatus Lokiarchaeota archaeon]|nr:aminotransferase class III-fold pyridoxal phosphate-dependent enzyme [Candidatus Lokiarchaeota archaeon]MBD3340997.1 aminotransferase class III-fold pyridoxal phosphate-dependent enzyme [Candidatus Lokiarchaeota archaeon]